MSSFKATLFIRRSRSLLRAERFFWVLVVNGETVARSAGAYANGDEAIRMGTRVCSGAYESFELVDQTGRR